MTDKIKKMLIAIGALAALALGGSALAGATSGGKGTAAQERDAATESGEGNESENSAADTDDVQDENGKDDAGEGSGESEGQESDQSLTGPAASSAREAAAAETGGTPGHVERDSEKGATYEVEVTKPDGSNAHVRLDDQFKVVAVDQDDEQAGEQDDATP